MKKLFAVLMMIFAFTAHAKSQVVESIFIIENDSIKAKTKFVDSLYFTDQGEPYTLFKSYAITSSSGQYAYDVELSNFNCAMGDGGYFRIIDIKHEGKSILQLNQSDGWDKLPKRVKSVSTNDYFIPIQLDASTTALIFIGYPYNSQPTQLTVVVLHKNKGKMVFNKNFRINKAEKVNTVISLTLHDQVIEYDDDGNINTTHIFKLWNEDGELKFGGSYGTASSNDWIVLRPLHAKEWFKVFPVVLWEKHYIFVTMLIDKPFPA